MSLKYEPSLELLHVFCEVVVLKLRGVPTKKTLKIRWQRPGALFDWLILSGYSRIRCRAKKERLQKGLRTFT